MESTRGERAHGPDTVHPYVELSPGGHRFGAPAPSVSSKLYQV